MDAPITIHAVIPTGIALPHLSLATFLTDVIHATPETGAGLPPATPIALHRKHSQEKPSYVKDLHPMLQ